MVQRSGGQEGKESDGQSTGLRWANVKAFLRHPTIPLVFLRRCSRDEATEVSFAVMADEAERSAILPHALMDV